jgi:hypothetical protein
LLLLYTEWQNTPMILKIYNTPTSILLMFLFTLVNVSNVKADSVDAPCGIHAKGEDSASASIPCTLSQPLGFDQTYELQGISFQISSANNSSINNLTIQPNGLEIDNSSINVEIDGTVTAAEIADLDGNGWPEIYVYVNSAGSGSYGSLVAFAVNKGKSISDIYLPPISDDKVNSNSYMGHDEFAVVENILARRFPIYLENDSNSSPSGGTRQLQYKLIMGEASWILKLDRW